MSVKKKGRGNSRGKVGASLETQFTSKELDKYISSLLASIIIMIPFLRKLKSLYILL